MIQNTSLRHLTERGRKGIEEIVEESIDPNNMRFSTKKY